MPRLNVNHSYYVCDGPGCQITAQSSRTVIQHWIRMRLPHFDQQTVYHRTECAIAHLSQISNGFDAAVIKARIGQPRPAGSQP